MDEDAPKTKKRRDLPLFLLSSGKRGLKGVGIVWDEKKGNVESDGKDIR